MICAGFFIGLPKSLGSSQAKNELHHVKGVKPTMFLSITKEGDRHILNPINISFNGHGRIEIDLAEIDAKYISDLTTKKGIKGYLIANMKNKNKIKSGDVQAIMDVVRTLEVLVRCTIPQKAIIDQITKEDFNELVEGDTRREPSDLSELKKDYDQKIDAGKKVSAKEVLDKVWESYYPSNS